MSDSSQDSGKRPRSSAADLLAARVDELRAAVRKVEPKVLAAHTGAAFDAEKNEFRLSLWNGEVILDFPALHGREGNSGQELPPPVQALLLYYFSTSDGLPVAGKWISFAGLPDGRIYNQAYQGYSGDELARQIGDDLSAFERAAEKLGGQRWQSGDSAYVFWALPRLPLLVVCWRGDEEFPSSCKILFDASASHHLPTDVCAILGSMLTRRLLKATGENRV